MLKLLNMECVKFYERKGILKFKRLNFNLFEYNFIFAEPNKSSALCGLGSELREFLKYFKLAA